MVHHVLDENFESIKSDPECIIQQDIERDPTYCVQQYWMIQLVVSNNIG